MKNIRSSLFGCTVLSASLLALAGCSGGASDGTDSIRSEAIASSNAQELAPGELELRVQGTHVPDWLLRISHQNGALSGHAVLHLEGGGTSDATPGNVTGTIAATGEVTLFIEPPAASRALPATKFQGTVVADGIVGTLIYDGQPASVKLVTLAPGATDDHGVPLLATTRHEAAVGDCYVDVTGGEFFALANDAVERSLNELFVRAVTEATKYCSSTSAPATVSGGGQVTLLHKTVVSVANVYTVLRGEDRVNVRAAERHTFDIRSGQELALFGDVLTSGSEAKLAPLLDAAVDAIRSDVLDATERTALKRALGAALERGALPQHYGLTDEAIIFDAPDFQHPRITGVRVPYSAVADQLQLRSSL